MFYRKGLWHGVTITKEVSRDETCQSWSTTSLEARGRGTLLRDDAFISLLQDDLIPCNTENMAILCTQITMHSFVSNTV